MMKIFVYYDENIYTQAIVREWLTEIEAAAEWFLGDVDNMKTTTRL